MTDSTRTSHLLSETLLAATIDTVEACVAILCGPELRYAYVNPVYQAISPDVPMPGRRYRDVFAEAASAGAEQRLLEVLATGQLWRIERYPAPIASDAGALWEGKAVRVDAGDPGAPLSVVVIVRNVAEAVGVERALADSESSLRQANDRLQKTIDNITDGVLVLDRQWRYTYVSERAGHNIGMKPADLVGGCVWALFPDAIGTKFYEGYHEAMATGQPVHFEEYYPHPLDMWLECNCYPSADELTIYFRDVSAQRRADNALRENTALLRAISDTSADIIFAKDRKGRMRYANPAALALIGKPLDQVLGRTDAEFLADREAARLVMENDCRIMETGVANELEERVPLPDGQEKIWLSLKIPYRDEQEQVVGLLGISRDITERKRTEHRLREESHRKDEFLAMLAHELRNPLAPITTAAQFIALFAQDEQRVRQSAQVISRQAAHMVGLVDDLLDVSRVTRGLIALQQEQVDIKSVIADAIEQARPLMEMRRHQLDTRMAAAHVVVVGDRVRLVQAIANLLNNAAKYTPPGGHISLAMEADDAQITLRVTDDGVGMPATLLPNVFDLFVQGERTPDRAQGGLGLGLALVRSVVDMHGGAVSAHSSGAGGGSTFTVMLPRLAEDRQDGSVPLPVPQRHVRSGMTVMIVDDNIDAAMSLAQLLEASGHTVLVRSGALEALEALETEAPARPDAFILDIGMPGMDGYELARRLRAQPRFAASVMIALTGYGQDEHRELALKAGFDHHLVKPVTLEKLLAVLTA